jgi:putative MATE family efflux protein
MLQRYIGDRAFYRRALATALPIILQNLITNFVAMLDNVMVGQLATAQIGAVTIVNNNLLFIFNLCMFGCASSAGIFTTQFHGSGNQEGIRHTFRFKMFSCILLTLAAAGIFFFGSDALVGLYLRGEGDPLLAADTLLYGRQYLHIMILGLIPFSVTNAYAGTLRECGHPTVPMVAGIVATAVNLVGNYVLIFGHFGAPAMGVAGAAIATVASRYVELAIVMIWTHCNPGKNPYIRGVYRSFHIPGQLLRSVLVKGFPLILNETLFSAGLAFLNQCYSMCGLDVVPALSISTTIYNLTAVIFRSLGITVGILTGQMLGAAMAETEVRDSNRKLITLCVFSGIVFGAVTAAFSGGFPLVFNTTDSVRHLAGQLILISAICMPLHAYIMPVYFTLRSGGKTWITFLFDCGAIWALMLPLAFCLTRFTSLPIIPVYIFCNAVDAVKCAVGVVMIRKGNWVQNLAIK